MSETTRSKAESSHGLVTEVAALELPEPSPPETSVTLDEVSDDDAARILARMAELDPDDPTTIAGFGAGACDRLREVSATLLAALRRHDLSPAGDCLREMAQAVAAFPPGNHALRRDPTLWERLTGRPAPLARLAAHGAGLRQRIDRIAEELLLREHRLLAEIRALDLLYERVLDHYDELALYIAAGRERLNLLPAEDQPAPDRLRNATQPLRTPQDPAAARAMLARRLQDLTLTRQAVMQALPPIRMVQENAKALVSRISATLVTEVPQWETGMSRILHAAADAPHRNSAPCPGGSGDPRGPDALRAAGATLRATLGETLALARAAEDRRARAEEELARMAATLDDRHTPALVATPVAAHVPSLDTALPGEAPLAPRPGRKGTGETPRS